MKKSSEPINKTEKVDPAYDVFFGYERCEKEKAALELFINEWIELMDKEDKV